MLPERVLIVACGALAREVSTLMRSVPDVHVAFLPATLHNRPDGIPGAVRDEIRRHRRDGYDRIFVAYADCGTGGLLDRVLEEEMATRLPGAHCYEVFAGSNELERITTETPGTFFLTDFLVRNFDSLVWRGLGLDRHPELVSVYFGNYSQVVYLAQSHDQDLVMAAKSAANLLGLSFQYRFTGVTGLERSISVIAKVV